MSVLGFIGDSITFGYGLSGSAPPALMCAALSLTANNQGLNGSSTEDWAITGEGKPLTNAMNVFAGQSVTTVLIMLGTNDAKPWIGITPTQYQANLLFIINALKGIGIQRIILNQPPAMQPSGSGIPDPTIENATLQAYQSNLQNLAAADPSHVFLGDESAFATFQAHPEYYQADGIHPNDAGAAVLAQLWKAGYLNPQGVTQAMSNDPIITPGGGPTTPGPGTVTPATISTNPADDFTFPEDVIVTRSIVGGGTLLKIIPPAGSGIKLEICQSDGTPWVYFDGPNRRMGVLTNAPNQPFVVNGNARIDGQLAMGPANPSGACLIDMINPFVGLGIPAMTQVQRRAITPNRAGNKVFCTDSDSGDTPGEYYNDGTNWFKITATQAIA